MASSGCAFAPMLKLSGFSPNDVTLSLLVIGAGFVVGNTLGGRLADWKIGPSLIMMEVFFGHRLADAEMHDRQCHSSEDLACLGSYLCARSSFAVQPCRPAAI